MIANSSLPWTCRGAGTPCGAATCSASPSTRRTPGNPEQLAWLEETLANTDAKWKLAAPHHPPYASGFHGSNAATREAFVPLFERYGVQIVFSGHEHDYQRTDPINGVTYVVSGGGSRTKRTGTADFTAVAYSTHHYVDLNIYDDHVLLRASDQDGEQFDETVIPVTIPPGRDVRGQRSRRSGGRVGDRDGQHHPGLLVAGHRAPRLRVGVDHTEVGGLGLTRWQPIGAGLALEVEVVLLITVVGHLHDEVRARRNVDAIGLHVQVPELDRHGLHGTTFSRGRPVVVLATRDHDGDDAERQRQHRHGGEEGEQPAGDVGTVR
jgi:Calcineurin-like phosphoesterase